MHSETRNMEVHT